MFRTSVAAAAITLFLGASAGAQAVIVDPGGLPIPPDALLVELPFVVQRFDPPACAGVSATLSRPIFGIVR